MQFDREFAPQEGIIASVERPYRSEICLNGLWQFQPVAVPEKRKDGPPPLPRPEDDAWEQVPIRIPSPWNVNSFSASDGGDFRCYPSYPASWETAEMGWLRRSFSVPLDWQDKRVLLRFESLAGDCEVILNSETVARHFNSFMPFSIDVTDVMRRDSENELLIGVRKPELFAVQGEFGRYTYPTGSFWAMHIVGIWQDVYLLAFPRVRIADAFVKPMVDQDILEVELTIRNDTASASKVSIGGKVFPWISEVGRDVLSAPEPKWRLDDIPSLELPCEAIEISAGGEKVVRLRVNVDKRLALWTLDDPRLYGLILQLTQDGEPIDQHYVRFGWRQFGIDDRWLTLNGKRVQVFGDAWHFMGIPQMTRRYAWAWFRMLKEAGANAVRLHAQPYPIFYLDVADEMGIMVLDESAIWASPCEHNYDRPETWERFSEHVERLILRDRNHPSVFGWSIANEINAALTVKRASREYIDAVDEKFGIIAGRVRELDPTRAWISSDGDEDMGGRLPTIIAHYGDVGYYKRLAEAEKPFGVGETGCAYYGTPKHVSRFNGDRAYQSFLDRMEGVAMEAYDLLVNGQRPFSAYCSIFNVAWYALKPLPLGLADTGEPPELTDGIFFPEYVEGKPGAQPERLGPYTTTLNPGYDPALPLYDPWPLFEAVKAAFAEGKPEPSSWDHYPEQKDQPQPATAGTGLIFFIGDRDSLLYHALQAAGAPIAEQEEAELLIIEGMSVNQQNLERIKELLQAALQRGGTVFVWGFERENLETLNRLLPQPVEITERDAVSLVKTVDHPVTASLSLADLYFAEVSAGQVILPAGLAGLFVEKGRVLLEACNTDWRRWNKRSENVKTGSVLRSELEAKPGGAALVELDAGSGRILISNILPAAMTPQHLHLTRTLLANLGVMLTEPQPMEGGVFDAAGNLLRALVIGSFAAESLEKAADTDFFGGESSVQPQPEDQMGELVWTEREAGPDSIIDFNRIDLPGSLENSMAYLSFWLQSPRPLHELLAQPDVPKVDLMAASDGGISVRLNGETLIEDYRVRPMTSDMHKRCALPLRQGWNHFLIKLVHPGGERRFSARLQCSDPRFQASLRSSLSEPEG